MMMDVKEFKNKIYMAPIYSFAYEKSYLHRSKILKNPRSFLVKMLAFCERIKVDK